MGPLFSPNGHVRGAHVHGGVLGGHPTRVSKKAGTGVVQGRAALACRGVSIGSDSAVGGSAPKGLPLSRNVLLAVLAVVAMVGVAAVVLIGGGHSTTVGATRGSVKGGFTAPPSATHAAAGTSGASARTSAGAHAKQSTTATKSVTGGKGVAVAEVRDPEEAKSFPLPASTRHPSASTPSVAGDAAIAEGAASDAEIRKELGEEEKAKAQERVAQHRVLTPVTGGFSVGGDGTIPIPQNVPEAVQRVIAGGNAIADFPYIWGGGHASFVANGYDCSGSVSYALAAGGLLNAPLVSGELASWGAPGPGKWITIYANDGHTFMDVDGMWFDTAGRSGPYASRWLVSTPPLAGYAVRHPPGF
jgi:cell wall-associated NlpC family hydrolase